MYTCKFSQPVDTKNTISAVQKSVKKIFFAFRKRTKTFINLQLIKKWVKKRQSERWKENPIETYHWGNQKASDMWKSWRKMEKDWISSLVTTNDNSIK